MTDQHPDPLAYLDRPTYRCPKCGRSVPDQACADCGLEWGDRPTTDDDQRMMQSIWPSTPGEATHALEDDPDPTTADDLPARLESYASGTPHMDGTSTVSLPKYHDKPGQVQVTLPGPVLDDLRQAAARIRELETEVADWKAAWHDAKENR